RRSRLPLDLALDPEILDHRVGEELPAHRLDILVRDALGEVELDELAGADVVDAREAEAFQRMVDRLALRVEDAVLQRDIDSGFHGCSGCWLGLAAIWPQGRAGTSGCGGGRARLSWLA